jgi:hypothetical protein
VEQEEDRSGTVGQCKRPEHRFTVTPWAAATTARWWAKCAAARVTPYIGARAVWRGSRWSTVGTLQGGGEARQPIAVQGRCGARTAASPLGGRRGGHEHVAHGERVRIAVRPGRWRRMDQRSGVGLGVQYGGRSVHDARHGA